jgi:large subunit ribosomal protein L13
MSLTRNKNNKEMKEWFLIDAKGIRLGKLATKVAQILQGKHKSGYIPNADKGDNVIVVNSKLIDVHERKLENKIYFWHSNYPGGLKSISLKDLLDKKPNDVIKKAIVGMMPKNKLSDKMIKKLFIYEDEHHKHEAQKPKLISID